MRDLSLHLLDLMQNGITAGAGLLEVSLSQDGQQRLRMVIRDDGCGMDEEMAGKVVSPFTTSRSTRKVGLGIPLTKASAERTGGSLSVMSRPGEGTTVTALFDRTSIDCLPMGDIAGTLTSLVAAYPDGPDIRLSLESPEGQRDFDTREVRSALGGLRLNEPEIILWIKDKLTEDIEAIFGGSLH